ncbi:DegT/DnrJ/EryC1/StrS family aminotransferase [Kitasatospora sp. NPDC087314]|uniref:DegT/DnrJ/EryC1/StrS family aminotransferase n=1 Tax=Kitasatospora sp. NPDC087314 TaxID=3364068 RepID=UPI0038243A0C
MPTTTLALLGGTPTTSRLPHPQPRPPAEEDLALVTAMLRRGEGAYVGDEGQVRELENDFRQLVGAPHALAVNSGTSALYSAFFGIGLAPGDEVLAPTYTFLATVMPLFAVNAVPVLVDVDEWTGNLDPADLERQLTTRTRAVVVTHLNGVPADMPAVTEFARRHGLAVVEDCSQAHGAVCAGAHVGSFGDAAAFSLQAKKTVSAGTGGILLTGDQRVYERAVMLGHFLDRAEQAVTSDEYARFASTGFGHNLRMHPVGAALARGSLRALPETLRDRKANHDLLDRLLTDIPGLRPPVREPYMDELGHYSYQPLYVPEELDGLPAELFVRAAVAEGVPLSRPRSAPLHCQPVFTDPSWHSETFAPHVGADSGYRHYRAEEFPGSLRYVERALRLPVYSTDIRSHVRLWAEGLAKVASQAHVLRAYESR